MNTPSADDIEIDFVAPCMFNKPELVERDFDQLYTRLIFFEPNTKNLLF